MRSHIPLWPGITVRSVIRFAGLAALGVAAFFMIATTHADPDLWGHVRFGLDILEHGRLHTADPYSFTSDRSWVNHEWLSEVAFALAWTACRSAGLIALKLAVVGATMFLVSRTLVLRGVSREFRVMLLGLALVGVFPRVLYVRPQLFSVWLFAALVWVLAQAERGNRKALALCPAILLLWTNFHGGWIVGLGALSAWVLVDVRDRRGEPARAWDGVGWLCCSAAATLVNPYGAGLWRFLLETVRPGREAIGEWGPVWNEPAVLFVWLILVWLTAAAALKEHPAPKIRRLILPVLLGIASLKVVRLDAFFALSVVGFLGGDIERFLGRPRERPALPAVVRLAIVAAMAILALAFPAARSAVTGIWMQAGEWPEPTSVEFIRANNLSGRMLTYFNWGQYAIWHLPPAVKVSIDGRRETVYSDGMISKHLRFYAGSETGVSFVEELRADYAWLPVRTPAVGALKQRGWSTAFEGDRSVILMSPMNTRLKPFVTPASKAASAVRRFPGP